MYQLDSYQGIVEYLAKGRNPIDRPAPSDSGNSNNTRIVRTGKSSVGIKLHKTVIIEYFEDGRIKLNTDGWKTITTRNRMNAFQNHFSIWQEKFIWYLEYQFNTYLYEDRMILFPSGKVELHNKVIDPSSTDEIKKANALKRKVDKYCDKFIEQFFNHQIPQPSGSDCWFCCMHTEDGDPMGKSDPSHFISHIEESYYVPSLLVNAINHIKDNGVYGLSPMDGHNIAYFFKQDGWEQQRPYGIDITKQRLKMVLKRYINQHVGLGVT